MRMNVWATSLIIGVALATSVDAQGPGGGGRRGMGMFGRGGILMLAGNEAVQKDLGLSDDETSKVKTVLEEYTAAVREAQVIQVTSVTCHAKNAPKRWKKWAKSARRHLKKYFQN